MKIFYFSGSGNSYWVAHEVAKRFSAEAVSITKYINKSSVEINDEAVGFVSPTYMGDLPWIMKDFLIKAKVNSNYIFLIMTATTGKSITAFKNADKALVKNGAKLSAGFNIRMPGNCIETPEIMSTLSLKHAPKAIESICNEISLRKVSYKSSGAEASSKFVKRSWFYFPYSMMKNLKVDSSKCIGCGICADVCPLDNIKIENGTAVHNRNCAACYACFHWCPQHATIIQVPGFSARSQYHHPDITVKMMKDDKKL